MSYQLTEQLTHDRINLLRLVRRIDKALSSREWEEDTGRPGRPAWIKTQGMLQKLKYARKLLKNLELRQDLEDSSSSTDRFEDLRRTIDRLEYVTEETNKRVTPKQTRPPPLLSKIPMPPPSARVPTATLPPESATLDVPIPESAATEDLLLPTSDPTPLPSAALPVDTASLLPANPPKSTEIPSSLKDAPAFLQTSAARHEEMTAQLAAMAEQLKRNAVHFAGALEKDKAVVVSAQEKIERNYDTMSTERVRLRDHRSKSWGTTWLVILSLVVAVIGFFLTFFVIRFT